MATRRLHNLLVKIPPSENKETAFEELLDNLHEIMTNVVVGFELVSMHQHIYFYVRVPTEGRYVVEGQIYANYPDAEIIEVKDYIHPDVLNKDKGFACANILLNRSDIYPIKTHAQFEGDSLAGIFSVLSKAAEGEEVWMQVISEPLGETWNLNFKRKWNMKITHFKSAFRLRDYVKLKGKAALRSAEKAEFHKKAEKNVYQVGIRLGYIAPNQAMADAKLESL